MVGYINMMAGERSWAVWLCVGGRPGVVGHTSGSPCHPSPPRSGPSGHPAAITTPPDRARPSPPIYGALGAPLAALNLAHRMVRKPPRCFVS